MKTETFNTQFLLRETVAGVTTFFTMAYIIFVNPSILSTAGTGMSFEGVLTATVILSFSMTLLMGLYAKLPFAVAPGMGINAFFTYSLILGQQIPFSTALGMVFWAGVIFIFLSVTPVRVHIAKAIPHNLRIASAAGIGIFLSFIGLKNMGLVVSDPNTFVKIGTLSKTTFISFSGLLLSFFLLRKKSPFAFLAGIGFVTLCALLRGAVSLPSSLLKAPNFSTVFMKLNFIEPLKLAYLPAIISILFTDLFDSISTFIGVSVASNLKDEKGAPKNLKEGLIVDAFATTAAGLLGTSSGTAYIESSAGIEMGGRTGWTSVVTALCFLPCLFLSPIAALVPSYATAPVLILVGGLMFRSVKELCFDKLEEVIPAFFAIILIPLTFSITQGILWGFMSHVVMFALAGRSQEIPKTLWGIAILSLLLVLI